MRLSPRKVLLAGWIAALALGLLHVLVDLHSMNEDGMSYMDMASAMREGRWGDVVNGTWSPLYAVLLAGAMAALRPSPFWEHAVAHLVNLGLHAASLGAFQYLLFAFLRDEREASPGDGPRGVGMFSEVSWIAIGLGLVLWSSLNLITLRAVEPDLLIAASVYAAVGALLEIRCAPELLRGYVVLGLALGFGYFAKAVMFPLAFVFLTLGLVAGRRGRVLRGIALAGALFAALASLWIVPLSRSRGRFTYSDSGAYNYAVVVDRIIPYIHWQPAIGETNRAAHPTRKIHDDPAAFEFASPVPGTYPVWYDPSYWVEGVKPRFDLEGHLLVIRRSAKLYARIFLGWQAGMLACCLAVCLLSDRRLLIRGWIGAWPLLIPAAAGLTLYGLVLVQTRYIGPFAVLALLAALAGARTRDLARRSPCDRLIAPAATFHSLAIIGIYTARLVMQKDASALAPFAARSHVDWRVAEALREEGLRAGDEVAVVGHSLRAYWARIGRLRIIAEVPAGGAAAFSRAAPGTRSAILAKFAASGAKAAILVPPARAPADESWRRIEGTEIHVQILPRSNSGG